LKYNISFPVIPLDDILYNPSFRINEIVSQIKPIRLFEEYLETGYYPFFKEGEESYHERLQQVVNHVLDVDLPATAKIDYQAVHHLRTLLSIISEIVPFKPNILKLSHQTGISRETMMKYLHLLEKADLLMLLKTGKQGISRLNKPEKVYLENTNLMYALTASDANRGSIRETFLCNQLSEGNSVEYPESGDFKVNDKFTIEVGGKNKTRKQIAGVPDSFIAADNIEYAYQNTIPLWLFGFLY
jgi:predicted AAA+ superfamily ATPase